jgi:hypothetical protein
MKLLGRDIHPRALAQQVTDRLAARGLLPTTELVPEEPQVEARVDPLTFNLHTLTENADPTQGLPLETHRGGLSGQLVLGAKRAMRVAGQLFINEILSRQRVFNGATRDAYAQLSAEVLTLRQRVAELEAAQGPVIDAAAPKESAPEPKKAARPKRAAHRR